jgi:CubicO group peptidase (beta-lactamase class C family)
VQGGLGTRRTREQTEDSVMVGRRRFLGASVGLLTLPTGRLLAQIEPSAKPSSSAGTRAPTPASEPVRADEQLGRVLAPVRDRHHLPGMIGAILSGERIAAIGAVGIRKIGSEKPIQVDDQMHLGSCTKAMTATLLGVLVDEGLLAWDSTIQDVFPDRAAELHTDFRSVTLTQLLTHRAGLPHDGPWWRLGRGNSTTEQRRAVLSRMLKDAPASRPGTVYAYSNVGYVLAGLMAEQVAKRRWEDLIRERLFEKLGMTSAGFGPPGRPDEVDQAWGHREKDGGVRAVFDDNAPVMAPACSVHTSLPDWCKFAALHLRGAQGKGLLLKPATFRTLHTAPPGGEYACGWFVAERSWAGGKALMHFGSNLAWFANVWIAPLRDAAFLVATNQGGDAAEAACDEAIDGLIRYHASTPTVSPTVSPRRRRTNRN